MSIAKVTQDIKNDFSSTTLHECSYDDSNKVHLVGNKWIDVYDFDDISEKWTNHAAFSGCTKPSSPDSVFLGENSLIFIEFKNTKYKDIDKLKVRAKIYETVIMLKMKYRLTEDEVKSLEFVLVYKGSSGSPATHKFKDGKCPREFKIIEKYLSIKLKVYNAISFDSKSSNILR